MPLHCTAQGKVLLAFGRGRLPVRRRSSAMRLARSSTPTVPRGEPRDVRVRGYATTLDELETGPLGSPPLPLVGRSEGVVGGGEHLRPDHAATRRVAARRFGELLMAE